MRLLQLHKTYGNQWKKLSSMLGRTDSSVRNCYARLRIDKSPEISKGNRCKQCGQFKRGHVCTPQYKSVHLRLRGSSHTSNEPPAPSTVQTVPTPSACTAHFSTCCADKSTPLHTINTNSLSNRDKAIDSSIHEANIQDGARVHAVSILNMVIQDNNSRH